MTEYPVLPVTFVVQFQPDGTVFLDIENQPWKRCYTVVNVKVDPDSILDTLRNKRKIMANTMLPILQFLTENQANSLQRLCNLKGPMPPESGILKALFDGHKHEDVKKELLGLPLDSELWQEYEFGPKDDRTIYRILNPVTLYIGNTTARVLDRDGIVHCVPAVGHEGCVLRWKPRPGANPCDF